MIQQPAILTVFVLLLSVAFSACGVTGGTWRFVLPLDLDQSLQVTSEIRIAPAAMEKDAARLRAVGTYKWGKFDTADLNNIEQSLRDTLASLPPAALSQPISRLDIHLMIRRYFVSVSNTGGAVLACVAWAATNSKGEMSYHEQFYATKAGYLVGTVGLDKDSVHRAIVRRIATTSMYLASGRGDTSARQTAFKNTYNSFEEAASHLPRIMVTMVGPFAIMTKVFWDEAKPLEEFNWNKYLRELYKIE